MLIIHALIQKSNHNNWNEAITNVQNSFYNLAFIEPREELTVRRKLALRQTKIIHPITEMLKEIIDIKS
jgi:hypothetical protein